MEVKKAIKKIIALGAGATMVGTTIMGAMAASLADYPSPFVMDGKFNGMIVVGDQAKAEDVIGATDIAMSLQYSMTTTKAVSGGGSASTVMVSGEAAKIATGTNALAIGEALSSVQTTDIDEDDLPTILADGTFDSDDNKEYNYEQKITLAPAVAYTHFAESDYNDKEPTLGIFVDRSMPVLNYTLDFIKDVESDVVASDSGLEDIENTELTLLGQTYDITEATNATKIKLTLMKGALTDVMEEGETKTFELNGKDYEVTVDFISTTEAKFIVNGDISKSLAEDATDTVGGIDVGVKDIMENEAGEAAGGDKVEFYLGAEKIVLEDTEKLEIDNEDVDELTVYITEGVSGTKVTISDITLAWTTDDETFITEDASVSFPGMGGFKLLYEGLSAPTPEVVSVENSGSKIIRLNNVPIKSGEVDIDILGSNTTDFVYIGGDDADEGLLTANANGPIIWDNAVHQYFVATYKNGADGESYLLEVTDIDDTDGVDVKDVANGAKYDDRKTGSFSVGSVTLTINAFNETLGTVNMSAQATTGYFDLLVTEAGLACDLPIAAAAAQTGGNNNINLTGAEGDWILYCTEEDKNENIGSGDLINMTLGHASAKVQVSSVTTDWANEYEIGDTKEYVGYVRSDLGTKINHDTDPDQDTVVISYYGEEVSGNVFIGEETTTTSTTAGEAGEVTTQEIVKIDVGAAVLASEVAGEETAHNLILVGGPCANAAAAVIMGNPENCVEGFESGKAKIKLYENAGNVAMLVAGATALDTRGASQFVAQYDKNSAKFADATDEIALTVTSLSSISASIPSAE